MYCPRCLAEYPDDYIECADCRVRLVEAPPREPDGRHALELVTILEVHDSFALNLAKASLEEAGIDYMVSGEDSGYLPGFHGASGIGATPLWKCSCRIQVRPEMEIAARELLEPLQSAEPADQREPESHSDR